MEIVIIILAISLIAAMLWGASYRKWFLDHRGAVEMSQNRRDRINAICNREVFRYIYSIKEHRGAYYVIMFDWPTGNVPIKRFQDNDKDYARRCAEELCEKLNESI